MKVAITGTSGFVGKAVVAKMRSMGATIESLSVADCADVAILTQKISGCNIIINLAGAPIIKKWSSEYKKTLRSSRIDLTNRLIQAIAKQDKKPEFLFSTSAVGYYKSNITYDENGENSDDFLGSLCKAWEDAALSATQYGVRVCIGRFGIVLGANGGALSQMLPIFKLGLGGVIASGNQPMSWIYLDDLVNAIEFLYTNKELNGVFNFTSPNWVSNFEFTKTLGSILNRPTFLPVPEFALKILYSEGAKVLTDGQIALPQRLLDAGFVYKKPTLSEALMASI